MIFRPLTLSIFLPSSFQCQYFSNKLTAGSSSFTYFEKQSNLTLPHKSSLYLLQWTKPTQRSMSCPHSPCSPAPCDLRWHCHPTSLTAAPPSLHQLSQQLVLVLSRDFLRLLELLTSIPVMWWHPLPPRFGLFCSSQSVLYKVTQQIFLKQHVHVSLLYSQTYSDIPYFLTYQF